jgi:hypothetical protein
MTLSPSRPLPAFSSSSSSSNNNNNNNDQDNDKTYDAKKDIETGLHTQEQELIVLQHQSTPNPVFQLNGQLRRVKTLGALEPLRLEPGDRNPDGLLRFVDFSNLRMLLKLCQISHMDPAIKHFWPGQLLRRILTKDRVKEELSILMSKDVHKGLWGHGLQWYLDELFPSGTREVDTENGAENGIKFETRSEKQSDTSYINLYAILILCEQQSSIRTFIEAGITDSDLPFFECDTGKLEGLIKLASWHSPYREIDCFEGWKDAEIEQFQDYQYRILVPYFCLASEHLGTVRYVEYYERTILPWIKDMNKTEYGGYGIVKCIRIHPACHGYQTLPQVQVGNGMFALKEMESTNSKGFRNETEMLRMFGGHHDHLITLLMSFSHKGKDFLLFPWADCDLGRYWQNENNKPPYNVATQSMDKDSVEWVSKQILGLASALHKIHNPKHLHDRLDMRYGRHGDIKPENILWLKSLEDPKGILVIGDLGIAAIHREISRSNQPGKDIPHSPDYRPPECDLEGGTISRAFDIWTLGCLYLEMICWVLGGMNLVTEFANDRSKTLYLGVNSCTNIFFHIQQKKNGGYVIHVKDAVARVS